MTEQDYHDENEWIEQQEDYLDAIGHDYSAEVEELCRRGFDVVLAILTNGKVDATLPIICGVSISTTERAAADYSKRYGPVCYIACDSNRGVTIL